MPRETSGSGEAADGRDSARSDDWQRIDAERAQREAARRSYDATHDPSEAFERAAQPLGPDYGLDRPRHREIPPEVAALFGRTPEQLAKLREKMFEQRAAEAQRWRHASDTRPPDAPRMSLDARIGVGAESVSARLVLVRFAGPEGLTDRQRLADEEYVLRLQRERPWLAIARQAEPLVRHVYCERDRAGGHDPARHDGFRDSDSQEQRAAASKDPAHPTDSPAYHNSVDHLRGARPSDGIGGRNQQHKPGEHVTWIADPTAWAVATARAIEHPEVKRALAAEKPPPNVRIPLDAVLGPDGHKYCDGYALVDDGFKSPREAKVNRDQWVAQVRRVMRMSGVDRNQAEAVLEQQVTAGEMELRKPEVRRIESFAGGTCQVNFRPAAEGAASITTICYNPPADEGRGRNDNAMG